LAAEAAFLIGGLDAALQLSALPRWRVGRWPTPGKVKIKVKGSGQECSLHTSGMASGMRVMRFQKKM
jgi:hypothetical protein